MPSATEATLFSVVCLQAVLALGWWLAGALMPASRREALYWGGYALLFGLALMLFMAASALADERLRAAGVCVVMVAMMALQRGVWAFFAKLAWRVGRGDAAGNDRHGHAAGDHARQHLAALLSTQARDIDRIGRYGGEEFTLLLPGASLAEAALVAERLRERVTALPLMWHGTPLALTVSIGLAAWQGDDDSLPALLQRADSALYRAKANGRNRVEVSEVYRAASAGALSPLATRPQ